jgi:hypothetical protein
MRWVIFILCISLTICAEDKKPERPRQVQPHFVGAGRPKDQMTKKKSRTDTKKWFLSKTSLKKHRQKEKAKENSQEKTKSKEKRPSYQKTSE